ALPLVPGDQGKTKSANCHQHHQTDYRQPYQSIDFRGTCRRQIGARCQVSAGDAVTQGVRKRLAAAEATYARLAQDLGGLNRNAIWTRAGLLLHGVILPVSTTLEKRTGGMTLFVHFNPASCEMHTEIGMVPRDGFF